MQKKILSKIKVVSFCFLIFFSISFLSAEYTSPISLDEDRIIDYKNKLTENSSSIFPLKMRLFFQGFSEDYAIFYDHNGHTAYYRYRNNKFDSSKKKIIEKLIGGVAYEVSGEFTGMIVFEQPYTTLYKSRENLDMITKKDVNSIPVFRLKDCKQIITQEIIF